MKIRQIIGNVKRHFKVLFLKISICAILGGEYSGCLNINLCTQLRKKKEYNVITTSMTYFYLKITENMN